VAVMVSNLNAVYLGRFGISLNYAFSILIISLSNSKNWRKEGSIW